MAADSGGGGTHSRMTDSPTLRNAGVFVGIFMAGLFHGPWLVSTGREREPWCWALNVCLNFGFTSFSLYFSRMQIKKKKHSSSSINDKLKFS